MEEIPLIIIIMVNFTFGLAALITIVILLAFLGRALGIILEDGVLYSTKFFLDFEIVVWRPNPGKYEKPKKNPGKYMREEEVHKHWYEGLIKRKAEPSKS